MKITLILLLSSLFVVGCSTTTKARRETRERMVQQTGVLCDFVNEADFKDVDVELNLRMANRCNASKPFSISGYKRANESQGFMFCCSTREASAAAAEASSSAAPAASENSESKTK